MLPLFSDPKIRHTVMFLEYDLFYTLYSQETLNKILKLFSMYRYIDKSYHNHERESNVE